MRGFKIQIHSIVCFGCLALASIYPFPPVGGLQLIVDPVGSGKTILT